MYAQGSVADLESCLHEAEGLERAEVLNRLATLLVQHEPERSSKLCREALEISTEKDDAANKSSALFGLGECSRVSGDYLRALEHYSASLQVADMHGILLMKGKCLRRLGDMQYFLTNLDLSLRYYLQALRLFEDAENDDKVRNSRLHVGHLYSAIGNVLKSSGDRSGAMSYYRQSLSVYRELDYDDGIPGAGYNIGTVLQEDGDLDAAEAAYRETLDHAEERNDGYLISLALNSLGSVFLERGDYHKAEEYFLRSMETCRGMNRKRGILVSLLKLVELKLEQGECQMSIDLSEKAEKLCREMGDKSLLCDILRERSRAYEMNGDHRSAYSALSDYLEIHQEQLSEKRVRQIDVLRLYYETEVREREIEKLSLTNRNLTRAYSRAEELTRTDALTGLANRRAALEWLSNQQDRYDRTGVGFGLILCDIDGFKSCNDRFGHEFGDAILVQLSDLMRENLRKGDLAVRWGGEEFLILLPETDTEEAAIVAESLREKIEAEAFTAGNESVHISMTFGVCEGGELLVDEVIRRADQAMYRGKHLGRNRVETSKDEPSSSSSG